MDEADAALGHASGEEAVAGERTGLFRFRPIKLFVLSLVFIPQVGEFGNRGLHPEGHLLLGDGRFNFRVTDFGHVLFVEFGDKVEHLVPGLPVDAFWIGEEEDGIT